MFLTRCELNPARRGARKLLGSPQAMHAAVMAAFPRETASNGGRALWRVDEVRAGTYLYLVSPWKPDLTHVVEQAGWPTTSNWKTVDYEPPLNQVEEASSWGFRLAADPTRSVGGAPGVRGKRVGHVTVSQQTNWLLERAQRLGFRIPEIDIGDSGPERVAEYAVSAVRRERPEFTRRRSEGGSDRVTIDRVVFEGRLVVTDPHALRAAMVSGIGPGKAYGCGLLTLARTG